MELVTKWHFESFGSQRWLNNNMNFCCLFSGARCQVAGADCYWNPGHSPWLVHQVQAHWPQEDYYVCARRGWRDDRHTGSPGPEHTDPQVGDFQQNLVFLFPISKQCPYQCRQLTKDCQMLLFSATFEDSVWRFAEQVVPDPNIIRLKREEETLDTIKQFYVVCKEKEDKFTALCNLYGSLTIAQAMIFCHVSRHTSLWLKNVPSLLDSINTWY